MLARFIFLAVYVLALHAGWTLISSEASAGPLQRWRARRPATAPISPVATQTETAIEPLLKPAAPPALALDPELVIADILRFRAAQQGETPEDQAEFAAALREVAGVTASPLPQREESREKSAVDLTTALERVIEHYETSAAELEQKFRILDAAEKRQQAELLRQELRALSPR